MVKKLLVMSAFMALVGTGFGQDGSINPCGFDDEQARMFREAPGLKQKFDLEQAEFQRRYEEFQASGARGLNTKDTIPVVVHIVHDGTFTVTDAQVDSAIAWLNVDFLAQNADSASVDPAFQSIIGNANIRFVLAKTDPNGNCHSGITRTESPDCVDNGPNYGIGGITSHNVVDAVEAEHGLWPTRDYMSIFVVKIVNQSGGGTGTTLAYSFTPSNWTTDGTNMYGNTVIKHDWFGTGAQKRTLTHEVGHWLNLSHTWGNGTCGDAGNCSGQGSDDGVNDTPNTIGHPSGCSATSTCGSLANINNHMEYSNCRYMFTQGQCDRMWTALGSGTSGRSHLVSTNNLISTGVRNPNIGVCEAEFGASDVMICAGESIDFTDYSYDNITSWDWTFNGGTPSTSTDQHPSGIVFNTPGTYDISLTVSDGSTSITETKTAMITILPLDGIPAPYYESFEVNNALPSNDLTLEGNSNDQWVVTSSAAQAGSHSARVVNGQNDGGNVSSIISNTFNLKYHQNVVVSYDYAYAQRNSLSNCSLKFYVSNDCGETWSMRKNLAGSNLATRSYTGGNFVPTSDEWGHWDVTNISSAYLVDGFRFKFEFTSDGGNNVYLDNINLDGLVSTGPYLSDEFSMGIFPNPVQDVATVTVDLLDEKDVTIVVRDMLGREIAQIYNGTVVGERSFEWNTSDVANGTYMVTVQTDSHAVTRKIIVE